MNNHSTPSVLLQPLLFTCEQLPNHFFRKPSQRELELLSYLRILRGLLTGEQIHSLSKVNHLGRTGYPLMSILSIMILKLMHEQKTMRQTLQLLEENGNLQMIVEVDTVPSEATMSRLSRQVAGIVKPEKLYERLIELYQRETGRIIGHLSIDSTVIEAREKPIKGKRATKKELQKRGPKKKGSAEEAEYLARKALQERQLAQYLGPFAVLSG